jgi:Protein of unknown function (DUF2846)
MRYSLLSILILCCGTFITQAQDYILLQNGDMLKVKFIDKTPTQIMYRAFGVKTAPLKSVDRSEVEKIVFQDGTELILAKRKSETVAQPQKNTKVVSISKSEVEKEPVKQPSYSLQQRKTEYSQDKAKVYFIRTGAFKGFLKPFMAFIDNQLVCKLNNKKYSIHEVEAGQRLFSVQFYGRTSKKRAERISINVETGKTYYVLLIYENKFIENLYCQEITENSAKMSLKDCEQDDKCL